MEPKHFILPVAALVAAGFLLGGQRKRISELRSDNDGLRARIVAAHTEPTPLDRGVPDRSVHRAEAVDWEKIVGFFRENPDGEFPGMFSIQRRLLAMEPAELLAALDGIAAMDLDDALRRKLEMMILDPLCKKDPEAALERFKGSLQGQDGIEKFLLTHALKDWARKDLAAATGWLDREVAAGTFEARSLDGKNPVWAGMEAAVVFGQFAADPAKAEARLASLPPEMRADILRQADAFHKLREGEEIAYAEIVRRQLDEKGRVESIADRARKTLARDGDFAAVDGYLNSVYAAPDERERAAEQVAAQFAYNLAAKKELNAPEIDKLRAWAERDAPDAAGRLAGEALGTAVNEAGGMDFAEASALALRYRENDGNDGALQSFLLKIDPKTHRDQARKLAETITDPQSRDNLLKRFE